MASNASNWKNTNEEGFIDYQPQIDNIKDDLKKQQDEINLLKEGQIEEITSEYIETNALNMPNSTDGRITIEGFTDGAALEDEYERDDLLPTSACFKQFFDLLHPVGSLYLSYTELTGTKTYGDGKYVLTWLFGSRWMVEHFDDGFLKCAHVYTDGGNDWIFTDLLQYGGNDSHSHHTQGHILTIDEMPNHTHLCGHHNLTQSAGAVAESWYALMTQDNSTHAYNTETTATGGVNAITQAHYHGDTQQALNIPKYQRIAIYRRIE